MDLTEKTLSSQQIFDGRLLKVYRDQVGLANGDTSVREFVHHPGGAAVVALDGEGNVYLERQFRYPYHKVVTEIPAGKLEPGEDPFDAIRRELKEEMERLERVPKEEYREFAELTSEGTRIWADARKGKNFEKFAPTLKKLIEYTKKFDFLQGKGRAEIV